MWHNIDLEHCLSFINCQLNPGKPRSTSVRPAITISRMSGSGGHSVASKLAEYLKARTPQECEWTIFDKNLVEKVLEEHHLPQRMTKYMLENHRPILGDMLEEFLGLHPSAWELARETSQTILHLAQLGGVIIVGRGGSVATARLDNAFHVRLIGSLEKRTERIQQMLQVEPPEAQRVIHDQDKARRRYLKENFDQDIDNPLLYHLIINTDRVSYDEAAELIGEEVIRRFHLQRERALV